MSHGSTNDPNTNDPDTNDPDTNDAPAAAGPPPAASGPPPADGWPLAELDPVRRLRVLAAALPGTMLGERVIAAAPDDVWAVAADLETELPRLIHDLRTARVTARDGDHVVLRAVGRLGQRARFDVDLRPGWCWMQSRFLLGGMAAAPHPDGTLFAFVGGLRLPGLGATRPVLRRLEEPLVAGLLRRLEDDVRARAQ